MRIRTRLAARLGVVIAAAVTATALVASPVAATGATAYGYPYASPPDCNEDTGAGCVVDRWGFYQGQCTSWVAHRLSQLNGIAFDNWYRQPSGYRWGNATDWAAAAGRVGIPVDGTPAVGAVAWFSSGHVGYVEQLNADGSVVMSEMNYDWHNGFRLTTISPGNGWPNGFIHIRDRSVAEGSFVQLSGHPEIYRIAGGAPVYVSSWIPFGGAQPVTPLSPEQFAALRTHPADGTFVGAGGHVYRFAGGAPVYVSSWDAVGGHQPLVELDPAAVVNAGGPAPWHHVRQHPADGTFIGTSAGYVYRFAGGAPIYVSTWDAVGGPQPLTHVDHAAVANAGGAAPWSHIRRYPADGTFIGTSAGYVYRFAGGAPLYLSTWDAVGGAVPVTGVDQAAVDNAGGPQPWDRIRRRPADGTFLLAGQTGHVYRTSGGVARHVASWAPYGGPQPTTRVDQATIDNAGLAAPWSNLVSGVPVVALRSPTVRFTTAPAATVAWAAPLQSSAIATYDVRYRTARWNSGFGAWQYPTTWQRRGDSSLTRTLTPGVTYCFAVRARNRAGLVSAWTAPRCVSRPLDDRALAGAGWSRGTGTGHYLDTYTATSRLGAELSLQGAQLTRLALVATTCPTCGTLDVYVGATRVGSVSLRSDTTMRRRFLTLPPFSYRTGTVRLRVTSTGRAVVIDGIAITRT